MASRNWKDDLPTLVLALAAQFGLVRAVDWARTHTETSDLARRLVAERFYFAPQIGAVLVVLILGRLIVKALNLRGVAIGEWLRSSILVLVVGVGFLVAAHLDQILDVLSLLVRQPALDAAARDLGASPFFQLLGRTATLRYAIDIAGLLVCLFAIRLGQPAHPEVSSAQAFQDARDWVHAGEAYLKAGDTKRARRMFKKAKAWPRLAALEQRDGNAREAARLYDEAGDGYAWEASRAWDAAGETRGRRGARQEGASAGARGVPLGPARRDRRGARRPRVSRGGVPAARRGDAPGARPRGALEEGRGRLPQRGKTRGSRRGVPERAGIPPRR